MNWQFSKNMVKMRLGFTMIESMVSIIVIALVILLIQIILTNLKQPIQIKATNGEIDNYLRVLESDHYRFHALAVKHDELKLYSVNEHKYYRLFYKDQVVRLTSEKGGYIPLLDDVKSVNWSQHKQILETDFLMNNGKHLKAKSLIPRMMQDE